METAVWLCQQDEKGGGAVASGGRWGDERGVRAGQSAGAQAQPGRMRGRSSRRQQALLPTSRNGGWISEFLTKQWLEKFGKFFCHPLFRFSSSYSYSQSWADFFRRHSRKFLYRKLATLTKQAQKQTCAHCTARRPPALHLILPGRKSNTVFMREALPVIGCHPKRNKLVKKLTSNLKLVRRLLQ